MSGHPEVNASALGPPAHDLTPEQLRRAGVTTVQYCLANRIDYAEMVEGCGAAPPVHWGAAPQCQMRKIHS